MWSCPGNMPKYYPSLRDILPDPNGSFCSDIWYCNILAYYLDKTTLLYKYTTRLKTLFLKVNEQ